MNDNILKIVQYFSSWLNVLVCSLLFVFELQLQIVKNNYCWQHAGKHYTKFSEFCYWLYMTFCLLCHRCWLLSKRH